MGIEQSCRVLDRPGSFPLRHLWPLSPRTFSPGNPDPRERRKVQSDHLRRKPFEMQRFSWRCVRRVHRAQPELAAVPRLSRPERPGSSGQRLPDPPTIRKSLALSVLLPSSERHCLPLQRSLFFDVSPLCSPEARSCHRSILHPIPSPQEQRSRPGVALLQSGQLPESPRGFENNPYQEGPGRLPEVRPEPPFASRDRPDRCEAVFARESIGQASP